MIAAIAMTGSILAVAAFVGTVVWAIMVNVAASDVHAWAPHLARQVINQAAQFKPEAERDDFRVELNDLIDGYEKDGRKASCLIVGLTEWQRAARTGTLPAWAAKPESEGQASLVIYVLVTTLAAGPAFCVMVAMALSVVGVVAGPGLVAVLEAMLGAGLVVGLGAGWIMGRHLGFRYGLLVGLVAVVGVMLGGGLVAALGVLVPEVALVVMFVAALWARYEGISERAARSLVIRIRRPGW